MEFREVPQWVSQSFVRSVTNAGATASRADLQQCADDLMSEWCSTQRRAHSIQHLIDMLSRVDFLAPETPNADLVRIASWFHGIVFSTSNQNVYIRNGGEDEFASAQVATEKLTELGLPEPAIKKVHDLIIGLKMHHTEKGHDCNHENGHENSLGELTRAVAETGVLEKIDMDQQALCDAHLGSLAVEPQRYRNYLSRVREEYAHIPYRHFVSARIRIVKRLLARRHLFRSPLAAQWEDVAKENLAAELERLEAIAADPDAVDPLLQDDDVRVADSAPDHDMPQINLGKRQSSAKELNSTMEVAPDY